MTENRHTDLIARLRKPALEFGYETNPREVPPSALQIEAANALEALSTHRRGEGEGATPFWVLEDPRCRSWSPTPQYLHKAAEFYGTGKWGKLGGGNELTTPDIGQARRFANRVQAEAFRDASPDLTAWAYEPCEHAMIGAMATPPAREGNDWAEHEDEIADAITDSIDMDWSSRDGARAVVRFLNSLALSTPPVQQEGATSAAYDAWGQWFDAVSALLDGDTDEIDLTTWTEWYAEGLDPESAADRYRKLLSTSAEPVQKTPETEHVGGLQEGEPAAWAAAAEPFFRLSREVINPVNGDRPWHADSKDWMVVFSFAGQSVTLGDLRRAAETPPLYADAILALSHPANGKEGQGSSVAESASTPDGRTEDQRAAGWRPSERFKAWSGGMDTEGENAGEFTAQVVFANHADCVSFLRFFATFDPAESSAEEDRS